MKTKVVSSLMILLLALACACGGRKTDPGADAGEEQPEGKEVRTARIERTDFFFEISSTGTLRPSRDARIRALASGPVQDVLAEIGDQVKTGQSLLIIRQTDAKLACEAAEAGLETARASLERLLAWQREEEVTMAEANLAKARAEYERLSDDLRRAEAIFAKGAISESQLQGARTAEASAEAALTSAREALKIAQKGPTQEEIRQARGQVKQAEAALSIAQQSLKDTVVRAPFEGIITERYLKQGDYAGRGDPVMDIVDARSLEAETLVPERYLGLIEKNLPVMVKASSLDLMREGEVMAVSPAVDPSSRTFKVKIKVNNQDHRFNPGTFCSCSFALRPLKDALGIPPEALQQDEGETFVWVNENNQARKVKVQTGEGQNGLIHIRSGLEGTEEVIIQGAGALAEGDRIHIIP